MDLQTMAVTDVSVTLFLILGLVALVGVIAVLTVSNDGGGPENTFLATDDEPEDAAGDAKHQHSILKRNDNSHTQMPSYSTRKIS